MANDIAELGIRYDSANLKKAKADLEALVPASAKAEKATLAVARASEAQARAALAAARANAGATAEEIKAAEAAVRQAAAATAAARANAAAAGALNAVGKAAASAAGQTTAAGNAANQAAAGVNNIGNAAQNSAAKLARLGSVANDNLIKVQATPANIAAQFQDIGVTAAAGMNPLLIGLQQGAQLGTAFAGGLRNIGAALRQVISPMSLFAIGLATAIAYAIQWGMEFFTAGKKTEEFGDKVEQATFATSALNNAQGILGSVMDITTGKINTQSAALIALARAQLAVAQIESRERMAKAGEDISKFTGQYGPRYNAAAAQGLLQQDKPLARLQEELRTGKKSADQVIKSLEGMVALGQLGQGMFIDLAKAYANFGVEAENQKIFEDARKLLDGEKTGTGYLLKPEEKSRGKSDGEKLIDVWAGADAQIAAENTRRLAAGLNVTNEEAAIMEQRTKLLNELQTKGLPITDATRAKVEELAVAYGKAKSAADLAESMTKIIRGSDKDIADLDKQIAAIGLYGRNLAYAAAMAKLLAEAKSSGMTDAQIGAARPVFESKAGKIADKSEQLREKEFMQSLIEGAEERNRQLATERGQLGLTGAALLAYRYEQEMLNAALREHIDLSDPQKAAIKETARLYGEQAEAIQKAAEAIEFDRSTTRGFFRDLIQGARDGKSAWQSFSDAFNNVMDRIIDKLLNEVLDAIFQVNSAAQGGGGGGLMGFLTSAAGLLGGSGAFGSASSINETALGSLRGTRTVGFGGGPNPDGSISLTGFAKGDAFTNSIVSRPTAFAFGKGGANLGIMGEAGAEAVMPLQRGPDGSLGVQMYGSSNDNGGAPAPGPVTFDMRGAVVTEDLLAQMNSIAADRADVAVVRERTRNERTAQRRFAKK